MRIIPSLVAFWVTIVVLRGSVALDILIAGIKHVFDLFGTDTSFVAALPTGLMWRLLRGSGETSLMVDTMTAYGTDSFVGRASCVLRGAADTTFYILPYILAV